METRSKIAYDAGSLGLRSHGAHPAAGAADLQIRELKPQALPALAALAAQSNLPTLNDTGRLKRYLEEEVVFGGFLRECLVGCCCIEKNVRKRYLTQFSEGEFPLPNLYFSGAFVLPQYRGCGFGGRLYQHRLNYARTRFCAAIIVELLGTGEPSSVDPGSAVGYRFYLKNGFRELGHSVDADAGKIVVLEIGGR